MLSSEVIPTESRRQGLAQDNPCPGDLVKFTCILNNTSAVTVRWTANGMIQYTLSPATDVGIQRSSVTGLNATFTNTTTSTLIVDLSKSIVITNGTEVGCVEVVGVGEVITSTETVEIIGIYKYSSYM